MKKLVLTLLFIVTCVSINAQTEKGVFFVGASSSGLGFNSIEQELNNNTSEKLKQLVVALKGGYFFKNDLMFGLQVPYQSLQSIDDDGEKFTKEQFVVSPTVRAYFFNLSKIKTYFELSYGFGKESVKGSYNNDYKVNLKKGTLDVGLSVFITQKVSFDLQFGYLNIKTESDDNQTKGLETKGIQSNLGISIFL